VTTGSAERGQVIAVLTTTEVVIAGVVNNRIYVLVLAAALAWLRSFDLLPAGRSALVEDIVQPRGLIAMSAALFVATIATSVVIGALRLFRFTPRR
jgi:hypothetical protein